MFKSRLNGLGLVIAMVLTGCNSTHPRDPFVNVQARPTELCLNDGSFLQNTDDAFAGGHPQRYVVKKGDTLWGISKRFLVMPWYWKKIWYNNPQIKNPHLIYPGDVLTVVELSGQKRIMITESNNEYHGRNTGRRTRSGLPIVKYSPHLRVENLGDEPITIAGSTLAAFNLKTQILKPYEIQGLPFIFGDAGDYLTLTQQREIYTKGKLSDASDEYGIYRVGDPIVSEKLDKNKKPTLIGYEMRYIGEVGVIGYDVATDLTKLKPLTTVRPLQEQDVVLPIQADVPDNYFPQMPSAQCSRAYIVRGTTDDPTIKEFDSVITSLGKDNGAQVGDIWKIVREGPHRIINGQPVKIPAKDIGYLMIYRVYDDVSLGFVLDSEQSIYATDTLVRP